MIVLRISAFAYPSRPVLPRGWAADYCCVSDVWEIGPSWYILPRRWYRWLRWQFFHQAVRLGALELKEEGGYFSEGRWFPRR